MIQLRSKTTIKLKNPKPNPVHSSTFVIAFGFPNHSKCRCPSTLRVIQPFSLFRQFFGASSSLYASIMPTKDTRITKLTIPQIFAAMVRFMCISPSWFLQAIIQHQMPRLLLNPLNNTSDCYPGRLIVGSILHAGQKKIGCKRPPLMLC